MLVSENFINLLEFY